MQLQQMQPVAEADAAMQVFEPGGSIDKVSLHTHSLTHKLIDYITQT